MKQAVLTVKAYDGAPEGQAWYYYMSGYIVAESEVAIILRDLMGEIKEIDKNKIVRIENGN